MIVVVIRGIVVQVIHILNTVHISMGLLWLNKCEYQQISHTGITTCKECGNTWDYLDHTYQESDHDCPDKSGQIITYVGN